MAYFSEVTAAAVEQAVFRGGQSVTLSDLVKAPAVFFEDAVPHAVHVRPVAEPTAPPAEVAWPKEQVRYLRSVGLFAATSESASSASGILPGW